jgi:hypothetical protein
MRRNYRWLEKQLGVIIACIGVGIITVVVVPFWWWVIVVGGAVVYCGYTIMNHKNH